MTKDKVLITKEEYDELVRKAEIGDRMVNNNSAAGKKSSANMTPEQRQERAKKASIARWNKKKSTKA